MTTPVTFNATVTDEYGQTFDDAIVAIRHFSGTPQITGTTDSECQEDYTIKDGFDAVAYRVNYWYNETTLAQGKRSRPLLQDNDGVFTDLFKVDLSLPEVNQLIESKLETTDKILRVIKADVIAKGK